METFKGKLKLNEADRSGVPQLQLTVVDEVSGLSVLDVLVDMEDFPEDYLDRKGKDCEVILRDIGKIGKIQQTKTILLVLGPSESKEAAIARAEEDLGDGWKVRARDVGDPQRYRPSQGGYVVNITRFVDPENA